MYDLITKKYTPTWSGILRIALWTAFFLWIAGFAIPQIHEDEDVNFKNSMKGKSITSMLPLNYMDRRIVREDVAFQPDTFNIAWLCDSTCLLAPLGKEVVSTWADYYGFIPEEVSKRLSKLFPGRKIHIYFYTELGSYPPDKQAQVSKVLASHPDMIVFNVNTIREYDTFSLFLREKSKPALSKIWLEESGLRILPFILISPATNLYAIIDDYFRSIREMPPFKASFGHKLHDSKASSSLSDKRNEAEEKIKQENTMPDDPAIALKHFWITFLDSAAFKKMKGPYKYFIPGLPDPETYIYTISEDTIKTLAESGIPTLVYPIAIAPFYQEDISAKYRLDACEKELSALKEHYKNNPDLLIIDRIPNSVSKEITFKPQDTVHLEKADAFISYMTDNIKKMIIMHDHEQEVKHEELHN
jgi:hypothetical protein